MKRIYLILSLTLIIVLLSAGCTNEIKQSDDSQYNVAIKGTDTGAEWGDCSYFMCTSNNLEQTDVISDNDVSSDKLVDIGYLKGEAPDESKLYLKIDSYWTDKFQDSPELECSIGFTCKDKSPGILFCDVYKDEERIKECIPIYLFNGRGDSFIRINTNNKGKFSVIPLTFVRAEKIADSEFSFRGQKGDKSFVNSAYSNDYKEILIDKEDYGIAIFNRVRMNLDEDETEDLMTWSSTVKNGKLSYPVNILNLEVYKNEYQPSFSIYGKYIVKENNIYYIPVFQYE